MAEETSPQRIMDGSECSTSSETNFVKNDELQHLGSRRQHKNAEVVTAVRKWLRRLLQISIETECIKSYQNGENTSMSLVIMLRNKGSSA